MSKHEMTDPAKAAEVAAGLTGAQRRALCGIPAKRDFTPLHTGYQWPCLACLKAKRLINGIQDGPAGMGARSKHRLTPLGLAVRAHLEGAPDV